MWLENLVEEMKIKFDCIDNLGNGGYGSVYKGQFENSSVAVKRVLLAQANSNEEESLKKLDHPNVVKLFHCESDDNFVYDDFHCFQN